MDEGVNELHKPHKTGDFIVDKKSGLTERIASHGEGMYINHWRTNLGYVLKKNARPASLEEIKNFPNQNIVVQILN